MLRLQKFLADAGVASRRASEKLILEGRVAVNNTVVSALGAKIDPQEDRITLDGRLVKPRRKLYIALHKPRGYLCTRRDPSQRRTIAGLLPAEWQHLYPIGRLDRESEGLLFLTNDGHFCLRLTHPRYGIAKSYRVTVEGRVEPDLLPKLLAGVMDDGQHLKARKARILSASNSQSVLELELLEGKYREIRRLCSALGLQLSRLVRTRIGPIPLAELPPGKWRILTEPEIKSLLAKL